MKIKIVFLLLMFFVGNSIVPQKASAQVSVSFQVFYDDLSPYGTWIDNPNYGYVWVPNVSAGFTPYHTNGHWVFTDYGWTWVSNYAWGWAPFHYGRWYTDPIYGSIWVPGNEWSPGWVTWRSSGSYYGWAPMGPGVTFGMAYGSGYYDTYNQYTFVKCGYMGSTNINNYYVNSSNNTTIINSTTVINNTRTDNTSNVTYSAGPERMEVEKRAGKTFAPVAVKNNDKPGQNLSGSELRIYKPQVQKNNLEGQKPAPTKVSNLKDVKTPAERKPAAQPQNVNQPTKQQPAQPRQTNQPAKQPAAQPQKPNQPAQRQPTQTPKVNQPVKQQPSQQQPQRSPQPAKQPSAQPQKPNQPTRQQPTQSPKVNQPVKQQPIQQPRTQPTQQQKPSQPSREQPAQQQRTAPPTEQQPSQAPRPVQPIEQKHSPPQNNKEQPRQQPSQPQPNNPPQNNGGGKKPN
jgi:hypothetical protein